MKTELVLFDLDGTLIDTTPLILESFKHTFLYHFNEAKKDEELLKYLGIPLITAFKDYPDMIELLIGTYREFNHNRHDGYIGVFLGITGMLEALKAKEIRMGIVTSKTRSLALRGLKLFELDKYMEIIVGMEDTDKHKPNAEPLLKALEIAGIFPENALYMGDSPYDILCARNAGVRSAAAGWSYLPETELTKCKPDILLKNPEDLLKHIR